jgi:hypothetical protein
MQTFGVDDRDFGEALINAGRGNASHVRAEG